MDTKLSDVPRLDYRDLLKGTDDLSPIEQAELKMYFEQFAKVARGPFGIVI